MVRLFLLCAALACCFGCVPETQRPIPAPAAAASNTHRYRQGYKPALLHVQLLYCRAKTVTGAQFNNTMCLTEEQIREQEENTRDTICSCAMHPNTSCTKPGCSS